MEGWLYKKSEAALQTWKLRWYVLQEGSLMYSKKQGGPIQGTMSVKGCSIEDIENTGKSDSKHVFRVLLGDSKKARLFATKTVVEKQQWISSLKSHSTMEPVAKCVPDKKKGALYSIESAAMSSKLGKTLLNKSVHADVWVLVEAFGAFLSIYKDETTAVTYREDVEKILTKVALLYQNKQISEENVTQLTKIGLSISQQFIDYYQMPSIFDAVEMIKIIEKARNYLEPLLLSKLTEKNAVRFTRVATLLQDEALLTDLFKKNKWSELGDIVKVLRAHVGHLHPTSN